MRSVLVASLRTHTRRYVAALLAVTIAVGFVVVTNALASATKNGLSAGVDDAYPGADLVIGDEIGIPEEDVEAVLAEAERSGDRATVVANTWSRVSAGGTSWGDGISISTVADDPELRRQEIRTGQAPSSPGEALVKASKAEATGIAVGDEVTIGSGDQRQDVRVVGLTESATYLDADVHVPWATLSAVRGLPDAVAYDVVDEGAVQARSDRLADLVSSEVLTRDDYVDDRVTVVNQGVDIVSYLLLLFAGIAGFVAVLVIANTFTILFAQRSRDLALLRCVGATRRQLLRSVRVESLLLALVAASVGVLGGTAAGYGITALVRIFAGDRIGAVELSPTWLAAAFVGGVLTTLAAAWWPTRAVAKLSPLAALRPVSADTARSHAGRVRIAFGLLVGAAGAALLAAAVAAESMEILMLGGMTSFVGILLLGPILVPALLRLVGAVVGRTGPSARIAAANTVRNPRRSAATTASLLVGVTLTTAVLTGMASARSAMDAEMDASHPVDVALTATSAVGDELVHDVEQVDGVSGAVGVPGVMGSLENVDGISILAPTTRERTIGRDEEALTPGEGEVLVPYGVIDSLENGLPEEVSVTADGHTSTLRARAVSTEWGEALLVAPDTLDELGDGAGTLAVWVRAEDGADADTLVGDLGAVARSAGLETADALQDRAWIDLQLDVLVWAVLGLLGVGVAIALVGIANTVGLSVLERGREHALLRALGLTRRQLRRVLAAEGLLLSVVAALLGTALGVTYAWMGVATAVRPHVPDVSLELPWLQLAGVLLAAALAGLAACVLPARRAVRVSPAEGLTLD